MNDSISYRKENALLYRVYAWMGFGLSITAITAYFISLNTKFLEAFAKNIGLFFVLFLLQLGLIIALNFFLNKMSSFVASITFIVYAILNGITLSVIFLIYTQTSIALTFFVASGMFAAMAIYGFFTKSDLSGMGNMLFMGIIGLIISLVINVFLKSSTFDYIISAIGVIIFSLLTAYDVQQIKKLEYQLVAKGETLSKISIIGALKLYLDFLNLFLYLLRFFGQRREN